jgi:thioredoxin reductase (NADPH)
MKEEQYDLIIIGGGPAGYTASLYASRFKLKHLIISKLWGGTLTEAHKVCNYPSEIEISGMDLMEKMKKQVEKLNTEMIMDSVKSLKKENDYFLVATESGKEFKAKTILLAIGSKRRKLQLEKEEKFTGRGISYCATCDAMFYQNKVVGVVGGANAATTASLYLAEIAEKVYQLHRGSQLKGDSVWIEQAEKNPKIEIIPDVEIKELLGDDCLRGVEMSKPHKGKDVLNLDGLFVEIGSIPNILLSTQLGLKVDDHGYVETRSDMSTSLLGVWGAGDITTGSNNFRQAITACAEGAIAAESISNFLRN